MADEPVTADNGTTLWAARDTTGDYSLWDTDPLPSPTRQGGYEWFVPGADFLEPEGIAAMLPDLSPGCKVQVRLVAVGDVVKGT